MGIYQVICWLLCAMGTLAFADAPFVITVVDEQTARGVPLVELETVDHSKFITDSAGIVAFNEPGFMGTRVYFGVSSHGYEFPKDGLGYRGATFETRPGGKATLKIKRLNIAERLYRVTGGGIYRDSILAGLPSPIKEPAINALVLGQDSVQCVLYKGTLRWFWGDTFRFAYPLGHFGTAGATSQLPQAGGLDPAVGVDLKYFVDDKGFSRPTVPGENLRWVDGVFVIKDDTGRERMVARCEQLKDLSHRIGQRTILWDDEKEQFATLRELNRDEPLCPKGQAVIHGEYIYFATPQAMLRVKADWKSVQTPEEYEGFTCLQAGSRFAKDQTTIDRDAAGKVIWAWKKNTPPVSETEQSELIRAGTLKDAEKWYRLVDVESKKPVFAHAGSVAWNDYRKKWIMIAVQQGGDSSFLGEVWYSEADAPQGPWLLGRKIITHEKYSFYNPVHHPFFDQQGGRVIYFEGTYAATFSRRGGETPRYDYNQIIYRLDLADERFKALRE